MRTLLAVKTEIAELTESIVAPGANGTAILVGSLTPQKLSRIKNRISFLKIVQRYMEEAPDELYITRDIKRIENRITALIDSFDPTQYKDSTEAKKKYENDMGIPQLRIQLRTLRFIKN